MRPFYTGFLFALFGVSISLTILWADTQPIPAGYAACIDACPSDLVKL